MSIDTQVKEVVQDSREWVEDQIEELGKQVKRLQKGSRKQVKLLKKQSRKLRKSLQREARKRRMNWMILNALLFNTRKNLQKRGVNLKEDLVARGGKVTQNVAEFGGKTTQNLAERSGELTQALAKQGQRLLEPVRKRDRTFWSILGFSVGLVAAATITYQLIRRQVTQQDIEEDEHIELPSNNSWNGLVSRPAGEISFVGQGRTSVATLEIVDLETNEQPAGAAFVGVKSTKHYYPVDTELEQKDLVYFTTEDEAKAQGFSAAE